MKPLCPGCFNSVSNCKCEEVVPDTETMRIANELRARCNGLTNDQREHYRKIGIKLINQEKN